MNCPFSSAWLLFVEEATWNLFKDSNFLLEFETWDDMFQSCSGR